MQTLYLAGRSTSRSNGLSSRLSYILRGGDAVVSSTSTIVFFECFIRTFADPVGIRQDMKAGYGQQLKQSMTLPKKNVGEFSKPSRR